MTSLMFSERPERTLLQISLALTLLSSFLSNNLPCKFQQPYYSQTLITVSSLQWVHCALFWLTLSAPQCSHCFQAGIHGDLGSLSQFVFLILGIITFFWLFFSHFIYSACFKSCFIATRSGSPPEFFIMTIFNILFQTMFRIIEKLQK